MAKTAGQKTNARTQKPAGNGLIRLAINAHASHANRQETATLQTININGILPKGGTMEEEFVAKLNSLIDSMTSSANAMDGLSQSITALVESNQRLMMSLAEGMVDEEQVDSLAYLDGSPK